MRLSDNSFDIIDPATKSSRTNLTPFDVPEKVCVEFGAGLGKA
jgi:hypothetical protein